MKWVTTLSKIPESRENRKKKTQKKPFGTVKQPPTKKEEKADATHTLKG